MTSSKMRGAARIGGVLLIGAMAITGTVGMATAGGAAAKVKGDFKNYHNKLAANTSGWCTGVGQPCDGVAYGTIDIVKASYSNGGGANYGTTTPAPAGQSKFARLHGGGTGSGGFLTTPTGCPVPGNENCTGAYTKFGNATHPVVFQAMTTSIKVYVDPTWAALNPGQVVDWDVALDTNTGGFGEDYALNLCSTAAGGGGFYVDWNNGSGGCSAPTDANYLGEVTTAGWYTFSQQFSSVGGILYCHYAIQDAANATVGSATENSGNAISGVGGPRYGWFADEDVSGLPVADVVLTKQ